MALFVETRCPEARCLRGRIRVLGIGVLGIALALLAAACGSGGADQSAATDDSAPAEQSTSTDEAAITDEAASTKGSAGSDEPAGSGETLADVLGPYFDPEYDINEELTREIDDRVNACMAKAGFEWHPSPTVPAVSSETDLHLKPNTREWTERYGFGITTRYFAQDAVGPDLVGFEGAPDIANMPEDPNQEYLDSLSSAEKEAWNTTLSGDPASNTPGCYDIANDEIFTSIPVFSFYDTFGEQYEKLAAQIQADPRIVEYDADVSRCVEEQGLTYQSEEQLRASFADQLQSIGRSTDAALESAVSEGAASANPPPDPNTIPPGPPPSGISTSPLSESSRAQLAELQHQEVDLAVAVWDCGGADRQTFLEEIQAEYERDFVAANRNELAEFKQQWEE